MNTMMTVVTVLTSVAGVASSAHAQSRSDFEVSSQEGRLTRAPSRAAYEPSSHAQGGPSSDLPVAVTKADQVSPPAPAIRDYPALGRAVEISVAPGYAQAFGKIGNGHAQLNDIGQAGGALALAVGYRIVPQLTLAIYGSGAMFSRGDSSDGSTNIYTATAGVQADWHFLPSGERFDPWVGLGTGWRGYWLHSDTAVPGGQVAGTTSLQGLELAKLQLGVDYRVAPAIAISPVVGADLSMFLSESPAGRNGYHNIESPQVNTFVFAGLLGRFDIPTGAPGSSAVARRE